MWLPRGFAGLGGETGELSLPRPRGWVKGARRGVGKARVQGPRQTSEQWRPMSRRACCQRQWLGFGVGLKSPDAAKRLGPCLLSCHQGLAW